MVAFRFLYLGLLIGTALALPVYPRSRIDEVITLREPASDHPPDIFPFEAGPQPPPAPPRTDRTVHFGDNNRQDVYFSNGKPWKVPHPSDASKLAHPDGKPTDQPSKPFKVPLKTKPTTHVQKDINPKSPN